MAQACPYQLAGTILMGLVCASKSQLAGVVAFTALTVAASFQVAGDVEGKTEPLIFFFNSGQGVGYAQMSRSGLVVAALKDLIAKIGRDNDEVRRFIGARVLFVENAAAFAQRVHGAPKGLRYFESFPVKVVKDSDDGRLFSLVYCKAAGCNGGEEHIFLVSVGRRGYEWRAL